MLEILKYSTESFWKFIGCYMIILSVLHYTINLIIRFFRLIQISIRGWSPSHLDADGDFKKENK